MVAKCGDATPRGKKNARCRDPIRAGDWLETSDSQNSSEFGRRFEMQRLKSLCGLPLFLWSTCVEDVRMVSWKQMDNRKPWPFGRYNGRGGSEDKDLAAPIPEFTDDNEAVTSGM